MADTSLPKDDMDSTSDDFEAIYESNAPLIYRFMFWRTRDEMLAEDLTSNVFEKAWRTRASFTGGSARAWLYRIARTTVIDYWRKAKDVPDDGAAIAGAVSTEPDLDVVLDAELTAERLQRAVAELPRPMRRVVELRFVEALSVRDVARELTMTEANVRVVQYRALRKLKDML